MKRLINAFIIFHLVALGLWSLPSSEFRNWAARPFENYIVRMGLWHVWDMFAPTPLTLNFRCEAEITYHDGSIKIWEFPRMEKLSLLKRIPAERYRKWTERVRQDSNSFVWEDTARFIARLNYQNFTNPPVLIAMTRIWGAIPPPRKGDYQPIPAEFHLTNEYTFYVYSVQPEDLAVSLKDIQRAWERFFFAPVPVINIAIYRILVGLLVLNYGALLAPDFLVWFGEKGPLPLAASRLISGGHGWVNVFLLLPKGDAWVWGFFWFFMAAAACLTLGFMTRVSSCLVFICIASLHHRNAMIPNSGDYFLRLAAFFMMFSQAGAGFSVDRLIRVARGMELGPPKPSAPWAMRMIQLQLCFLYVAAFLWKIRGEMWLHGVAVYYPARLQEFYRFPVPYIFEHMWTIKFWTWGTLLTEFSLGTLVWIKELKYWVLLAGVLLHGGIAYSMNIPMFAQIMISTYLLWVEPEHLRRCLHWLGNKINGCSRVALPIPVFYDGKCSFCQRSVEVIRRIDILKRFRPLDSQAKETVLEFPKLDRDRASRELLVRTPKGEWLGGFKAFPIYGLAPSFGLADAALSLSALSKRGGHTRLPTYCQPSLLPNGNVK